MSLDPQRVEQAFDEALAAKPGSEREAVLVRICSGDAALRREVEELLRAHDGCVGFLEEGTTLKIDAATIDMASRTAVLSDAVNLAAGYLDGKEPRPPLEDYLSSVPDALRLEVRERIEAAFAFRVGKRRISEPSGHEPLPDIPGFELRRVLGRGGLGTVYEGWDEKLQRSVALKVLRVHSGGEQRSRILNEARLSAAVRDPAIVTIYSVLDESDPPAIVMELVGGFPLDQFCQNLTFQQKARLLQEVARGLAVAHGQGLIHRDLKPDNVVVGPDMKPKILDFGLAVPLEDVQGGLDCFEGSPLYASPEQVACKALTASSDVFSFGSMMFKVLTGSPPFSGSSVEEVLRAVATSHPPFLRNLALGTPEDLQAVCLACLSWNPKDRPTAAEVVVELGRYLAGEPVHMKPKLYDDILRQRISEYSTEAQTWKSQSMISGDERDALEVVHRRVLAEEDHWIIDARRLTLVQCALYLGSWGVVVAASLMVGLLREDLTLPWRWLMPLSCTTALLMLGWLADRRREALAAASFLAAAALSIAPSTLVCLAELHLLDTPVEGVAQLFRGGENPFTNQQLLAAAFIALVISSLGLARLKMTGFAWTTAVFATVSYLGLLLQFNWLDQEPYVQALWCLPLAAMEAVALAFEKAGRVRWTMPFHLVSLLAMVASMDIIASEGPTLELLGVAGGQGGYFDDDRILYLSFVLNGLIFLTLMLLTERAASLDLRRAAKVLELLGILHLLGPLYVNAFNHRGDPLVAVDVALYLGVAAAFLIVAPWRSRWRLLVGGLGGLAFGSHLLVELDLVAEKPFVFGLAAVGLILAAGTFVHLRMAAKPRRR